MCDVSEEGARLTTISTPIRSAAARIVSANVRQRMLGSIPLSRTRSRSAAGAAGGDDRVRWPVDLAGLASLVMPRFNRIRGPV